MRVFFVCIVTIALTLPGLVSADNETNHDTLLVKAFNAHRKQQSRVLEAISNQIGNDDLADYPHFWYLSSLIDQGVSQETINQVHRFKDKYPHSPLYPALHNNLLYALFNSHQGDTFLSELEAQDNNTLGLQCAKLVLTLNQDTPKNVVTEAKSLWLNNPDNHLCSQLVAPLTSLSVIDTEELWQSLHLALHNHQDVRADLINQSLPNAQHISSRDWQEANNHPKRFLNQQLTHPHLDNAHYVLIVHAIQLFAKDDDIEASQWWQNHASMLPPHWRDLGWAEIAYQGALNLNPSSLDWFHRAHNGINQDHYRAWHVRMALRNKKWQEVLNTIETMPPKEQKLRMWQYWQAEALMHLEKKDSAKVLLQELTHESDFYGLLAQDELGVHPTKKTEMAPITDNDTKELLPHMERALRLHRLNIKPMDRIEWNWANQKLTARQHLIAAQIAKEANWLDRSIYSASQVGPYEDLALSYPTPFEDTLKSTVKKRHLDEAWVYGLIRQESQFAPQALSRTGAQGLMQIMPMTARWIAKHLSLKRFLPDQTTELETNLNLGTYYLQHLLEQLNTPALATAGYNAGPRRVKQWLSKQPMDGIVFVDTIPFNETRDYVKRVMTNTVLYSKRLQQPYIPLKQRIGLVPAVDNLQPIHLGEP
ncbi:lytic transglycosylase domain-containing protein [Ferrovum sp. PN-J185]|uniref:lytic transglycosylase domain-containing protein n=1 Tax=Ferrovum sp. PN-J185 TaxID=1356306 RepID=UPI001E4490FB|nr:lytic transglycosylase domain-containing protein [Ferrovum sp. PN-J185]MCC6067782.1 lytic transglycosylase domain-containing protein [Ferrovum sp. PN-J185]MDE1892200.1 lytic transglycosylase domain-containing protein [Betaproteobacteria bacterium]